MNHVNYIMIDEPPMFAPLEELASFLTWCDIEIENADAPEIAAQWERAKQNVLVTYRRRRGGSGRDRICEQNPILRFEK